MAIPSELREVLVNRKKPLVIQSPMEDERILRTRRCTQAVLIQNFYELQKECVWSQSCCNCICGQRCAHSARTIPWVKANLNHTGQALIISAASIAAYFITVDKTILECARRNAHYKST